ncbi:DUF6530 family protein [Eubacteriales bacterium OttesenSCG-928-A19]|nr:DUF6530 family protein [Eubacteriales bacterium OttesenSCG-928-A19]
MNIPTHLKHKPVIEVPDYENIDSADGYDPAQGLSLGLAQWNDRGRVDVSAKIWRHTGEKWSRQSEEMPLHRVIDLAILICEGKRYMMEEAYRKPGMYDADNPVIDRVGLQGDAMTIRVCTENERIDEDIKLFDTALRCQDERLSERLQVLARTLKEMGY